MQVQGNDKIYKGVWQVRACWKGGAQQYGRRSAAVHQPWSPR
jgi:hypothetical protein